jgi:hypothetical protein
MRFLPCPTSYGNSIVPVVHCLQNGQVRLPLPEPARNPSVRIPPDEQRQAPSNDSLGHSSNPYRRNLLEAFVISIFDHSPFRSNFSPVSGYLRERGIAAYEETARSQQAEAEITSRFIDTYV